MSDDLTKARTTVLAALARDGVATPPRWRTVITDSESPTGVAPVCTGEQSDALHVIHDYPGGPIRDEDGVYDCCPWPQFDTYSADTAAYLVALLNADAEGQAATASEAPPATAPELPVWLGTPVTCPHCDCEQTHCNTCHFDMHDPPIGGGA